MSERMPKEDDAMPALRHAVFLGLDDVGLGREFLPIDDEGADAVTHAVAWGGEVGKDAVEYR